MPTSRQMLIKRLKEHEVVKYGSFEFSSGIISRNKVVLDEAVQDAETLDLIAKLLYNKVVSSGRLPNVIVGQVSNGDRIAEELAKKLGCKSVVYDKKTFSLDKEIRGKQCWLVDDVYTTGGSLQSQRGCVELNGNSAVGASVVVTRRIPKGCRYLTSLWELLK